ncbi:MAG: 3'(2'),5'-bisphosphate nucleotidase CysQ [Sphingomonadaceae bacterium]|nr:3'(2'),5'-bisphosphate nucleotidase CysQ [Sphingomonadaceae bacterium]
MVEDDAALAARLAREAGAILCALRADAEWTGKALGDAGDSAANAFLLAELAAHRPDDAVLSEEVADDGARHGAKRLWIIDPLDGTREYAEGRDDWAVHVALTIDGRAVVGAVALPARGMTLSSADGRSPAPLVEPPRMLVSRSRPPELAERVAAAIGAELIPMGSAGAKAMAVLLGEGEIYLHAGGQHMWDNAAPVAVAAAAGLHCSRMDGAPMDYAARDTLIPDLLICHPDWAARVLAAVAG